MRTLTSTEAIPQKLTPVMALELLKLGNFRFVNNLKQNRDLLRQVNETKDGQWPFATILSCMDSRTSAELIFDQGLGDIFSIRIAGNIITPDIIGSIEYATAVAGSKLIVVLGHTDCGAIKGACDKVQMGNLTGLLQKIEPVIEMEKTVKTQRDGNNREFVNKVVALNARYSAQHIANRSTIISELIEQQKLKIVSAVYDISTGKVEFDD